MKVILTDLTRMREGRICVAGVDREAHRHVRLTLPDGKHFDQRDLVAEKGPLHLGRVVDVLAWEAHGQAPETEDILVRRQDLRFDRGLAGRSFHDVLEEFIEPSLASIFGSSLTKTAHNAVYLPANTGQRSLGLIRLEQWGFVLMGSQLRLEFTDPSLGEVSVRVTDCRTLGQDGAINSAFVSRLKQYQVRRSPVLLSMGLSRAFQPPPRRRPDGTFEPPSSPLAHWMQVNGIHFGHR